MRGIQIFAFVVAVTLIASADPAHAYIGPGAGVTVIGTVVALFGAILLAIVGFVWYPIKRMRARMRGAKADANADPEETAPRETNPT